MSGNPPRKPPGSPPGRPALDVNSSMRAGLPPRPAGPPPNMLPVTSMKPPPRAPPPAALLQNQQRPPVDLSTKSPDKDSGDSQPKSATPAVFAAPVKAGGITMFEETEEDIPKPTTPGTPSLSDRADSKVVPMPRGPPPSAPPSREKDNPNPLIATVSRSSRPPPPLSVSAGIPVGQPQPPGERPPSEGKAPPPTKLPPNRSRAPPREEPTSSSSKLSILSIQQGSNKMASPIILPPDSEPPLLRIKRAPEKEVVKRREREMPEFEESDDDDEGPPLVKQPLPFGVIKQELPGSKPAPPPIDELKSLTSEKTGTSSRLLSMISSKEKSSVPAGPPPAMGPLENKVTEFVPAAPPTDKFVDMGVFYDSSNLGKTLTRGRINIKCIEGVGVKLKNDNSANPRVDPFIKFRLGIAERHPWKNTKTQRKQNDKPKFNDEIISFDIVDVGQYIFQEDLQICIELWNKGTMKDDLIGSVTMSVVRFMKQPYVSYVEKVPIYYPGETRTQMKLTLEFIFEEARSGLVQITLYHANGLRNIDPMGHQQPYVQFSLGRHYKKRSKSIKDDSVNPNFNEEEILLWLDQENWVDDLVCDLLDEDAKEEKPIGSTHFSLLPYIKIPSNAAREDTYDLFYTYLVDPKDESSKREVAQGEITLRVRFMVAGKLMVTVDRAKDLEFPEIYKSTNADTSRMDPYANLTVDGKAVKMIKKTPADKDGGHDPIWQSQLSFDIVDQYLMDVEVFNQNVVGKDVQLGTAQISLLNVFRTGKTEYWTTLKQKKANGGIKEVGDIFIKLVFTGPVGIAYPQFRPEVDSFDDSLRILDTNQQQDKQDMDLAKPAISTIPNPDITIEEEAEQLALAAIPDQEGKTNEAPPEFDDAEILAAFRFIDLDKNNFVGAAEIRHILVCMGEMITDEEIDMMIGMVDMDGDGQVSYKEFRTLVLHPNPGVVDLHKEVSKENENELMRDKQAMAGKKQGVDLTSFQRQKEMSQREIKKKMIVQFVIDNEVNYEYIKRAHMDFLEIPMEKRAGGRIRFPEFCQVLRIEPITDYKNLHSFYDSEEMGDMDIREYLLSMLNFVEVSKEERIKFSFTMFDELKTGFIAKKEVEEILRGNHMISLASVQRKAETIMKQAHTNKQGAITMNEFVVVSKKFPNILLPAVGYIPKAPTSIITTAPSKKVMSPS